MTRNDTVYNAIFTEIFNGEYQELLSQYFRLHPDSSEPSCCCATCVRLKYLDKLRRKARDRYSKMYPIS